MGTADDHRLAFIDVFVLPRRRERYRSKPAEFLRALAHRLPDELDERRVITLDRLTRPQDVGPFLKAVARVTTGVYLGPWHGQECGEYPLERAVELAETFGGAIVGIHAGELAFHVSEHPGGTRRLLALDEGVRAKAESVLARLDGLTH